MLKHIEYSLEFSNGQKRSLSTDLQHGSTMITGRNGRGKSLLLEMFAFALFGAKALRGIASDYKKMDVTVVVTIRGKDYEIKRTKSKAQISNVGDVDPLATTTSPVNQFIEQLLGYNYDVFRVSNWCAQGDIQALANMKPTERKAMIDNVAGLTQLDGLIEIVKSDIKTFKASISAVESAVVKPLAPIAPQTDEETLIAELEEAKALQAKAHELGSAVNEYRFLQAPQKPLQPLMKSRPLPPTKLGYFEKPFPQVLEAFTLQAPVKPTVMGDRSYEEMVTQCRQIWDDLTSLRTEVSNAEITLQRLPPINDEHRTFLLNTDEEYWRKQNKYWDDKLAYDALLSKGNVTCPNCTHLHPVASDLLNSYDTTTFPEKKPLSVLDYSRFATRLNCEAKLQELKQSLESKYGDANAQQQAFDRLDQIKAELVQWKKVQEAFERAEQEYQLKVDSFDQLNARMIFQWENECARVDQQNAEQERQYEKMCSDIDHDNAEAEAMFTIQLERFSKAQAEYEANVKVRDQLQADLNDLLALPSFQMVQTTINRTMVELNQWSTYKVLNTQYLKHLESYNQAMARVENERLQLEDCIKAQTALVELKARVKTYIIPSLNKVASYLLSEMTGGEHNSITIGEDFEVYVDSQPLRTMSGSGKDIANLSIRIALGRILTHKVLGMVMLDEIDQGMDESRAAYTWECLEKITPQIGQVLQVSHKELRAENRLVIQ